MRLFSIISCTFLLVNICCIFCFVWVYQYTKVRFDVSNESANHYLRNIKEVVVADSVSDTPSKEKRFSIVIVTHMETLLEKTYPTSLLFLS